MAIFLSAWALIWKTVNWFSLSYGLALYVIILPPMIKFRKSNEFDSPFFHLCTSMAFFDIFGIVFKIISPILDVVFMGRAWMMGLYGYATYVPWWGVQLHQLLIALDRAIAIVLPNGIQTMVFGGSKLRNLLVFVWLTTIFGSLIMFTELGFTVVVNDTNLISSTQRYRLNFTDPRVQTTMLVRDVVIQGCIYACTIVFYLASFVGIRGLKRRTENEGSDDTYSQAQISMAVQGVLVTAPQILGVLLYFLAVYVSGVMETVLMVMIEFFNTLYNCINPLIYLLFSSNLRKKVIQFYIRGANTNKKESKNNKHRRVAVHPV